MLSIEKVLLTHPVAHAEYRRPAGSIQASPCLSPRRVVCARRVGERPVGRGTEGTGEAGVRSGVSFLLVTFLWTSKEESPRVQGRSHPQLAFEIARKARETFKTWISAFAEMTAKIRAVFAGMTATFLSRFRGDYDTVYSCPCPPPP